MDIPSHGELVAAIDAFLARHPELSERQIGIAVCNDPSLVGTFRRGRNLTLDTLGKLSRYMADYDAATPTRAPEWPITSPGKTGEVSGAVALCPVCERRPDAPEVRACIAPDCGLAQRTAA